MSHNRENKEMMLMEELLREKLDTFRPSVHAKEAIYTRLINRRVKTRAKHWYVEVFLILKRASMTATVTFGVLIFGMTSSYAYFSPNVNSESSLYFLKRSVESVEYSLAFSEENKIEKLVKFTYKREKEIEVLAGKGIKDVYAIKQIEKNIAEANLLLEKVEDVEVKKDLFVKVNGEEVNVADFEKELEEEVEEVEEEKKAVPIKLPVGIVKPFVIKELAPMPALEEAAPEKSADSIQLYSLPIKDGMGGGYDTAAAPKVIPDVCFDLCSSGEIQQCGDGTVKTCGNFDKDECYEWSVCKAPVLLKGYQLDDFEWDL